MKKYFVAAMISMVSFFSVATEVKVIGWKEKQDDKLVTYQISNTGNKDGVLTIGCEKKGEPFTVKYVINGKEVEMFIIETLSTSGKDTFPYVSIYGLNSMTSDMVLEQIENTDQGFVISRFENGDRARYRESRETGDKSMTPIPVGNELFTGYEFVGEFVADLKQVCGKAEDRKF